MHTLAGMTLSLTLSAAFALPTAGQWHQYLGPSGDATSAETRLLDAWPADGPAELWRVDLGPGYGGAAVRDGHVFLLDREHGQADILRVLDLKTGDELWRYQYDAVGRVGHEGSRCTPSVTETHVFTTGQLGHLYAFDRATREVAWSINLLDAYPDEDGNDGQNWGYGMNPLLLGDTIVAASPSRETPGLVAFDQRTGEVVWESEAFGCSNMYSSPQLRTIAGTRGIVVRTVTHLFFIDPATGTTLFSHACYEGGKIPITPVTVLPDGEHVLVTNGYDMGSVMLAVTRGENGAWQVEDKYRTVEGSQIHPAIAIGEHLYINHTENSTSGRAKRKFAGLACVDPATGAVLWNTGEEVFFGRGGTLCADGNLIMQDAEGGMLYLIEPSPEGFKPISSFQATDASQKKAWAPLALADGRLLVRDQDELVCFDLRAVASSRLR